MGGEAAHQSDYGDMVRFEDGEIGCVQGIGYKGFTVQWNTEYQSYRVLSYIENEDTGSWRIGSEGKEPGMK